MNSIKPDFSLKNISDYSIHDLESLWIAIKASKIDIKSSLVDGAADTYQALDIWEYRLGDALKIAKQRETELKAIMK